jgi:AAA15 family ATPase/GTPase
MGFREFDVPDLTPINVIVGPNDSGKTAILKLLYGVSKSVEDYFNRGHFSRGSSFKKVLSDKLLNTFQPRKNGLGEMVSRSSAEKLNAQISYFGYSKQHIQFSFGESTFSNIIDCTEDVNINAFQEDFNVLFIPAKEVLTAFEAIAITREQYNMLGFDDSYYDLIRDLRVPVYSERTSPEFSDVNKGLENLFEGFISQGPSDNPFIFKKGKTEFGMPMTAEGIKKIGILNTLIGNRKLRKNTILFLDEPETALHPKAVRFLAEMIYLLSVAGVQIFLTSHNYFLIKQLALIAKREKTDINCLSFNKEMGQSVSYLISNMRNGVPDNQIIKEALEMFNEELKTDLGL